MQANDGSAVATACTLPAPGNTVFFRGGTLALGQEGTINNPVAAQHLNISAPLDPTNAFEVGALTRSKRNGSATLAVTVPSPGELTGSGKGAKIAGASARKPVQTGSAQLLIRATGSKKRKLKENGKAKVKVNVTYTPAGGDPRTETVVVKLRKRV